MKNLVSLFSKDGKISSKRVFGGLGILVILGCYIKCSIDHTELPTVTEFIFACCVTLLGCDSVVNAFNNKNGEQN